AGGPRPFCGLSGGGRGWRGLTGVAGGGAGVLGPTFLVKGWAEAPFFSPPPAAIDPPTVLAGVAWGFCTAVIFGLRPIVQASQVRPIAVLCEFGERNRRSVRWPSLLLHILTVELFLALAMSIVGDAGVALGVV